MRMIAGLEEVTEGEISIDGKRINELDPKDRDVAMVFSPTPCTRTWTLSRTSGFPLKVRKVGFRDAP